MLSDEPVTYWLRQLEAGDEDAARLLWQRYYRELVELARARLGTTPRRVADEEDVALSVMRCLYDGSARGQFVAVINRQELWQLLATITVIAYKHGNACFSDQTYSQEGAEDTEGYEASSHFLCFLRYLL